MLPFNEIGLVKKNERVRRKGRVFDENVKHQHLLAHDFFSCTHKVPKFLS